MGNTVCFSGKKAHTCLNVLNPVCVCLFVPMMSASDCVCVCVW